MYYGDYELTGDLWDDREKVARALDDPNLSYSQKQEIVDAHNWKNIDSMSMDSYTNHIVYGVLNTSHFDYPSPVVETEYNYSSNYVSDTPSSFKSSPKKVYDVSFSDGHLFFDDKKA